MCECEVEGQRQCEREAVSVRERRERASKREIQAERQ